MLQGLFLKIVIIIQGLGAASGIIFYQNQIYAVADDQTSIYRYDLKKNIQEEIKLNTSIAFQEITKKNKLDYESMSLIDNKIYCLGSGSKSNRNEINVLDLKTKKSTAIDISNLYQEIRNRFAIEAKDFNIEGFSFYQGYTYLFNRGNGKNKLNAIIKFKGLPDQSDLTQLELIKINLPKINDHQTTFSDALIVDDQIIYTATIEVESTVEADGEVKESIIGAIDLPTFTLKNYQILSKNQKIEGITLKKKTSANYHFLLCEDNDDNRNEAMIYELKISKDLAKIK